MLPRVAASCAARSTELSGWGAAGGIGCRSSAAAAVAGPLALTLNAPLVPPAPLGRPLAHMGVSMYDVCCVWPPPPAAGVCTSIALALLPLLGRVLPSTATLAAAAAADAPAAGVIPRNGTGNGSVAGRRFPPLPSSPNIAAPATPGATACCGIGGSGTPAPPPPPLCFGHAIVQR
jgi:hypothetical protein